MPGAAVYAVEEKFRRWSSSVTSVLPFHPGLSLPCYNLPHTTLSAPLPKGKVWEHLSDSANPDQTQPLIPPQEVDDHRAAPQEHANAAQS